MRRIRVLLAELTGVLGGVVRGVLEGQDDMEIVGEVSDLAGIRLAVMDGDVDLVIWGTERATASDVDALLEWQHLPKVLAIEDDGRYGSVWQLRHEQTALGQLSPGLLVNAIRRVCAQDLGLEG